MVRHFSRAVWVCGVGAYGLGDGGKGVERRVQDAGDGAQLHTRRGVRQCRQTTRRQLCAVLRRARLRQRHRHTAQV